jgi:GT2 family glycosyltransferase
MKLSVIIVNYNVKQMLLDCLASLQSGGTKDMEVIVVDNCSTDGSVIAVKELFPEVKLVVNTINIGFSAANNQGLSIANGDWLLLLNPDTKLKAGALAGYLSFAEEKGENNIYGPKLLNGDGSLQRSAWKDRIVTQLLITTFFLNRLFQGNTYPEEQFSEVFEPDFLSGASLLFHRSLYKKLGELDTDLFWMEDVDLCYRNKISGGSNYYFPGAEVFHFSGQSSKKNYNISISNQLISKLKFFRKHSRYFALIAGSLLTFIHIILRLLVLLPVGLLNRTYFRKWTAYWYTLAVFLVFIFTGKKAVT